MTHLCEELGTGVSSSNICGPIHNCKSYGLFTNTKAIFTIKLRNISEKLTVKMTEKNEIKIEFFSKINLGTNKTDIHVYYYLSS